MFLKSLTMKGFKSFADPTVLEFEPGITVVVGPNGSGKSNVVDAVTWVLGAQGPRSLRSQKMEDVIFAGTASRPALGRAEVSLTIDNASGKLPVDMAEVTITRTLFRSGDSEYAINGAPCRLLDIQELLSDSGVGRQQHMIIGQGQLDAVLNARPEERRAVIEEAAGVLKHRRRRERAERRLAATQENLERLGDLIREVRRQIRPLERQAAAARSHSALAAELRAVRLHAAGAELADLAGRRSAAATALAGLAQEESRLHAELAELDRVATSTASELSSRREVDLASALGRLQGLVERARGTAGVLKERARGLEAALDAAADVDVVSTLEAEGARLVADLEEVEGEKAALAPERDTLIAESADLEDDAARYLQGQPETPEENVEEVLSEARNRRELLRRVLEQDGRVLEELDARLAALGERLTQVDATLEALGVRERELEAEAERLVTSSKAEAEAAAQAGQRAVGVEREADEAEQHRHRTEARAEALERALRELEGAGGREVLSGVAGVVGSLMDLVEIDPGWEAAFEAAAGASVVAVVVEGRAAARQALELLHRQGTTGALLAARSGGRGRVPAVASPPSDAEPVRSHVRPRAHRAGPPGPPGHGDGSTTPASGADASGIDEVLDALVGDAVRVGGWERAVDLALERPDLVVVTADGDRFADSGWRVRASKGLVTAAAVEDARRQADQAAGRADEAAARLALARREAEEHRASAAAAARAVDRHEAARAAAAAERSTVQEERRRLVAEIEDTERSRADASQQVDTDAAAAAELDRSMPELEAAAREAARRAHEASAVSAELDARRQELATRRHELEVREAALDERHRVLLQRRSEVERRLQGHVEERQEAAARRRRLEFEGLVLRRLEAVVEQEGRRLEEGLATLRADYRRQVEAVRAGGERLETIRQRRNATESALAELRERVRALDLEAAEVTLRGEALDETVQRELGSDVAEALEAPAPDIPDGLTPVQFAAQLADQLAALGPVNPLALDELSALEERYHELDTQVADVRSARRELQEVVRVLDDEIMQSFAAAAADVNEHFSALVAMLFPGGTGRISLTEPDDLLNTGVDIEVRPAGRNVRRVSLLSGGERSLAALAFLFGVFRSRPSPFYLMDEVEAALDDVNLHRFLDLVREFRDEAQLIIVSHQKRTMETGDALYGVTMAPGGSSQVVSQKVTRPAEPAPS